MYFPGERGLWGGIIEYLEVVCWWGRRGGGYAVMGSHSLCTLRLASFCEWEVQSGGND